MADAPTNIRVLRDDRTLELVWNDQRSDRFSYYQLRCECPCAACVNEFTGERILDPQTISQDVHPSDITFSGNYALKIYWNDGHSTGIYSWEHFERLGQSASNAPPVDNEA